MISRSIPAPWQLASIAALPLLGCGPGGVGNDFRITAVELAGAGTLTLTFSQPVANPSEIDPNDFRISLARTNRFTDPESNAVEEITIYTDIGGFADYDYYQDPERFAFTEAFVGSAANQLVLEDANGILAQACMFVSDYSDYYEQYQYPGLQRDIGMFLHYAGGEIPVESEAGQALADIGPDWVLTEEYSLALYSYGFVNLVPMLRIPCP